MRLIVYLLSASLAGFAAHRAYKPSKLMGERWGTLLRYGIGGVLLLPFLLMFTDILIKDRDKESEDAVMRTGISYLISAAAIGAGVMTGHIVDRLSENE